MTVRFAAMLLAVVIVGLVACTESPDELASSAVPLVTMANATSEATDASVAALATPTSAAVAESLGDSLGDETPFPPTQTAIWPAAAERVPCGVLLPILASGPEPEALSFGDVPEDSTLPDAARPALDRILAAPQTVGLVAYQVGRETEGIYLNADTPMPLASVVKIINLIAYAQAVSDGQLDPAEWIPLSEIGQTYLPRSDRGAHSRALRELEERQLIAFDPPATPLEEVPWMMIRHSSNAATDYLHLRLGQQIIEQTIIDLGLESHTAPCPWVGQFLTITNRQTSGSNRLTIREYIDDPRLYGSEVMRLAESYAYDEAFRNSESQPAWRAAFDSQLLFADNLNAKASARDYASLLSRIVQNQISDGYANILIRRALEWPMIFPVNQELFTTIGLKDGSLPGVLTTAYYAQRVEDGATVIVVLFYRQLPSQLYRQWLRDLPNDEFARWLLADPAAIPQLRAALQPVDR